MAAQERVELQVFFCKEAYVYQVPPATTVGHRADLWNVNKWLTEVAVRVVTADEDCYVRLEDCKSGELFAECPVPRDAPLVTVVEPVIDSSRYFVLRIVDRDTDRHAFVGLGFRERSEASNFNAALYEHLQYLKRKRVAEARRKEFEEREQRASEEGEAAEGEAGPAVDYSIKPGEKITIKLNVAKQDKAESFLSKGTRFNLFAGSEGGASGALALSPPPAPPRRATMGEGGSPAGAPAPAMCISPRVAEAGASAGAGSPGPAGVQQDGSMGGDAADASAAAHLPMRQASGPDVAGAATEELQQLQLGADARAMEGGSAAAAAHAEDDDWGDFTSS